jgi:DNA-binding MarR family transcriptional regulator
MTILADQQDQTANTGETIGMTLNKIFELYHRQSPKFVPSKLADSESSIQQAVRELWMDEFIEKVVSPRAGTVSTHRLTAQGWDYVNKIRDLEDERNQLFESCVASEEERKYVETYLNRVADTIETRMARGSVN